jgi:pyruvate,orthophosphate dikinase
MFGRIVMDVPGEKFDHALDAKKHARGARQDTDLSADDLRALVDEFKSIVKEDTGRDFPSDPYEQLDLAIKAVFRSWFGKRAMDYRNSQKIAHDLGTAVNVVTMVFGNMGDDSGTGVAFTRDPNTGEKTLFGEYLTNAQGEDVVAGIRTAPKIAQMQTDMPQVYAEFQRIGQQLESHYRDVQDLEFTIERGKLYMLQTRSAKRTAAAAVRIAVDMVEEGLISKDEAIARIEPAHVDQLLRATFDPAALKGATKIVNGLNASPGAAVGRAVFDADTAVEWVDKGEKVILVRVETSPDDFHGMAVAQGIRRQAGPLQRDRHRIQGGRLGVARRLRRRAVPRRAPDRRGQVRGSARTSEGPRLGRRHPADAGVDQRRQARGGCPGAQLRRPGHRPVPDRAHVPRGRAARDRARGDPRRQRGHPGQGEGRRR